jgi:hypothetical protein
MKLCRRHEESTRQKDLLRQKREEQIKAELEEKRYAALPHSSEILQVQFASDFLSLAICVDTHNWFSQSSLENSIEEMYRLLLASIMVLNDEKFRDTSQRKRAEEISRFSVEVSFENS